MSFGRLSEIKALFACLLLLYHLVLHHGFKNVILFIVIRKALSHLASHTLHSWIQWFSKLCTVKPVRLCLEFIPKLVQTRRDTARPFWDGWVCTDGLIYRVISDRVISIVLRGMNLMASRQVMRIHYETMEVWADKGLPVHHLIDSLWCTEALALLVGTRATLANEVGPTTSILQIWILWLQLLDDLRELAAWGLAGS